MLNKVYSIISRVRVGVNREAGRVGVNLGYGRLRNAKYKVK